MHARNISTTILLYLYNKNTEKIYVTKQSHQHPSAACTHLCSVIVKDKRSTPILRFITPTFYHPRPPFFLKQALITRTLSNVFYLSPFIYLQLTKPTNNNSDLAPSRACNTGRPTSLPSAIFTKAFCGQISAPDSQKCAQDTLLGTLKSDCLK